MSGLSCAGGVCAVVIAYHPDAGFAARLDVVRRQVDRLVVIDNTPGTSAGPAATPTSAFPSETFSRPAAESVEQHASQHASQPRVFGCDLCDPSVRLVRNERNLGIAAALNQGLAEAAAYGCRWTLTLDQDTHCRADMVETLLAVAHACQPSPAVVGGNYFDHQNQRHFMPEPAPGGSADLFREVTTVITSGCLVDTAFALGIGGFREDYFIDQVDHEFCLRTRRHGRRVVISRRCVMEHSVGNAGGAHLPFLGTLPNHAPVRKYYITRNTLVTVATYWMREPGWCLRRMLRLMLGLFSMALLEPQGPIKVRAFGAGFADGLRHRMGPSRRRWLG